jgi:cysteinyl-tRNA synthetase
MALHLYNTLGRSLQAFVPIDSSPQGPGSSHVGFYGCGPTVYNYAHIGNMRAYLTHDLIARVLRRRGYALTHVMNITDVGHLTGDADEGEDKMLKTAEERGKSVLEIAEFYTEAFFNDCKRLNIQRPDIVCRATEHIDDMITLIKRIEANGYTYSAGGNLYFDTTKFPHYWDLRGGAPPGAPSDASLTPINGGGEEGGYSRTGIDPNKKNPLDFVLWFTSSKFANQALTWESPWGRGYPGWHIECSAMSMRYLGEQFDIHAGGIDHIPIHHSNEIAQSEAATGKHPWVKYWMHNEFLVMAKGRDNEAGKMSKSDGTFLTVQTLVDAGYDALDYRYFILGAHYRSQLQFSFEALDGARSARKSLLAQVKKKRDESGARPQDSSVSPALASYQSAFENALDDDLNSPKALAALWGLLRDREIPAEEALAAALDMDSVLGLGLDQLTNEEESEENLSEAEREEIEALLNERTEAKKRRDFKRADEIRAILGARGIIVEDGRDGSSWKLSPKNS